MDDLFLEEIGFCGVALKSSTVGDLVDQDVLDRPLDGNHGEIHPKASDYVENGIPFVMATDLKNGRVDLNGCYKIPENIANELRKGFAKTGDVLLSHKATLGRVAKVSEIDHDFIVLTPQTTYYRVLKPNALDPDYLVQYFRSQYFQDLFKLWGGSGSTRAYLGITAQKKLPIVFPPVTTQRKIAAILTAYDDLIENNRQRIALLEEMAEEIYREWFVRLRFPGHEHTRVHKGVPEGWVERAISDIVSFKSGFAFKSKSYLPGAKYGVVTIKNVHDGKFIAECSDHIPEAPACMPKHCALKTGDILMSLTGNVGRVCVALGDNLLLNQRVALLQPKLTSHSHFIYWLFRQGSMLTFCEMISTGAAQQNLSPVKLSGQKLVYPPAKLAEDFQAVVDPLMEQILTLLQSNTRLAQARDLLLNRLISGKLRVDDLDIQFPPSMQEAKAA